MEQNEIKEYRLLYIDGGEIKDNGSRWGTFEQIKADLPDPGWAIIPADEVPENWPDMTIVDGMPVAAPAEVLEARQKTRIIVEAETVRVARESRYQAETDALMYDAIEAYALAHSDDPAFAAWISAKDRIRQKLPKPQEGGGE